MPFLTPLTTSTVANTTTANGQVTPRIFPLANGQYIIIWQDNNDATASGMAQVANSDVRGQIFNADGTPSGSEILVTGAAGTQYPRSVIQLSDGNIIISWQDGVAGVANPVQSFAQEYTTSGVAVGSAFQIGGAGASALNVALTPLANGGFAATWLTAQQNGSVVAQVYDNGNTASGSQIAVNATDIAAGDRPNIATLSNGTFVVAWRNSNYVSGSGSSEPMSAQIYSASGLPIGAEVQLPGFFGPTVSSQIEALPGGGFAVLTISSSIFPDAPERTISIYRYDSLGNPVGEQIYVASSFDSGFDSTTTADLAVTADGRLIVTWQQVNTTASGSERVIAAAFFTADGDPIYPEGASQTGVNSDYFYTIHTDSNGTQNTPVVAVLADGNVVFSWTDNNSASDGSQAAVRSVVFDIDATNRSPLTPDVLVVLDQAGAGLTFANIPGDDFLLDENGNPLLDLDGDAITLTGVSNAQNGTVVLNPDGTISFTPNAGYTGPARFSYTLTDSTGATSTGAALVVETIDDRVSVRGGQSVNIDVTANDYLNLLPGQSLGLQLFPASQLGFVGTPSGLNVSFNPLSQPINLNGQSYFDLQLGQNVTVAAYYTVFDSATGNSVRSGTVSVELQGWAQLGGTGADTFTGTDLADHLSGGTGAANILTGLSGDDWYTVRVAGDNVIEALNGGTDTVRTDLPVYILPDNVENLVYFQSGGTNIAIDVTGNALNNRITGGSADDIIRGLDGDDNLNGAGGTDRLFGDAGNDTLTGSAADQLSGGTGDDQYSVNGQSVLVFENAGEGTDRVTSTANFYLYANIENLTLSGVNNIFGVGNDLANVLRGNSGENLLIAGAGNDTVHGGGARDAIFGEDGDDILNGDAGIDYIVGGTGNDTIAGGDDADEIYGQDGNDTIRGGSTFHTDIMVGGLGDDTIFGTSGLGDYDLLYGNEGNDTFYVDTPDDLVFEQAGEGTDTVYADINGAGYYLYGNIENLVLLDDTPFGVGNDLDNSLTGSGTGNYLLGGAGNDTLNGMGGNDVLFGEGGNDIFVIQRGTGTDVIGDFTIGQDRIDLSGFNTSFAQLQSRFVQDGSVGAIRLASGDLIVLHNVTMSQLTAADFIFAPVAEAEPKDMAEIGGAFAADGIGFEPAFADTSLQRWGMLATENLV